MSEKRRNGFVAATCRHDITTNILCHDRICSQHFLSDMLTSLENETTPDWLPSLNLGHDKVLKVTVEKGEDRWKQRKTKEESTVRNVTESINVSVNPDHENSGKLHESSTQQTDLTPSMIDYLRDELNLKVCSLIAKLTRVTPFSEESLQDDEYVRFYTGLSNFGVLKSVFDFASLANASTTKLTHFQEFMVTLMKLAKARHTIQRSCLSF